MTMSTGFGNIGAISPQSRTPQALQASLLKPPLEKALPTFVLVSSLIPEVLPIPEDLGFHTDRLVENY